MQSAFFPQQTGSNHKADVVIAAPDAGPHLKVAVSNAKSTPLRNIGYVSTSHGALASISSGSHRFPSSRQYLWDRTAAGPQVLVDVLDFLPHVQVAASAFGSISRAAKGAGQSLPLQLDWSISSNHQISALLQEHDPLNAKGSQQLICRLLKHGAPSWNAVEELRPALQTQLEQRDIARVQQLFALAATAVAGASAADQTSLQLHLLMPRASLLAIPLYTKRLCHVPLAEALLKPGCVATGQSGYLSMDQARSLLPMEATDANVYSTPLVGVWVKGPSSVLHPLVAAACLRFAFSSLFMDRAVHPEDGAFLVLLCPEGDPVSKCFEVRFIDSSKLELSCFRLEAWVRPAGGSSQFPGGLVSATWVPEQTPALPLPATIGSRQQGFFSAVPASSPLLHQSPAVTHRLQAPPGSLVHRGWTTATLSTAAEAPVLTDSGHITRVQQGLFSARSSAPSSTFVLNAADATAPSERTTQTARRSLPLFQGADSQLLPHGSFMDPAATSRMWGAPLGCADTFSAGAKDQAARSIGAAAAAAPNQSPSGAHTTTACMSPGKALSNLRQQQLQWSDRQDQVLRSSLEGAAEALRSSQTSLAAAREAASGAGSRLSSPVKASGTCPSPAAHSHPVGAASAAVATGADTDCDSQPCMGSPVRLYEQCRASMLAANAAQQLHSAGDAASPQAAAVTGCTESPAAASAAGQCPPAPPAIQAGVALSNLSLLQHLSSGQLQRALQQSQNVQSCSEQLQGTQCEPVLAAVGDAAVAAVGSSDRRGVEHPGMTAQGSYHSSPHPHDQHAAAELEMSPPHISGGGGAAGAATPHSNYFGGIDQAATAGKHCSASDARAAAGQDQPAMQHAGSTSSSLHLMPVDRYSTHSLGTQRYAADLAVMRCSQQGLQGVQGMDGALLSPGSSRGLQPEINTGRLHQQSLQQLAHAPALFMQSRGDIAHAAGVDSAPSTGFRSSSIQAGPSPPRQHPGVFQGVQQVSPGSAAASPSWVSDPVAQALQGEVERLRQQLQQLQHQLKLAGMSLSGPDAESVTPVMSPHPAVQLAGMPHQSSLQVQHMSLMQSSSQDPVQQQQQHRVLTPVHQMPRQQQQPHQSIECMPSDCCVTPDTVSRAGGDGQHQTAPMLHAAMHPQQQQQSMQALQPHLQAAAVSDHATPAVVGATSAVAIPHPSQPLVEQQCSQHPQHNQQQGQHHTYHQAARQLQPPIESSQSSQPPDLHAAQGCFLQTAGDTADADAVRMAQENASAAVDLSIPALQQPQGHHATAVVAPRQDPHSVDGAGVPVTDDAVGTKQPTAPQAAQSQAEALRAHQDVQPDQCGNAQQRRRKLDFSSAAACDADANNGDDSSSRRQDSSETMQLPHHTATTCEKPPPPAATAAATPSKGASGAHAIACSDGERPPAESYSPADKAEQPHVVALQAQTADTGCAAEHHATCASPSAKAAGDMPACLPAASPCLNQPRTTAGLGASGACSTAGLWLRGSRSSAGALSQVRASLDAPPLVEVVRARVVDLSDDSDSDDWEDGLLVKYGLK